jgi:hypothetical protein
VNPVRFILKTGLDPAFCCVVAAPTAAPTLLEIAPNARGFAELPDGPATVELLVAGNGTGNGNGDGEGREATAGGCPAESAIRKASKGVSFPRTSEWLPLQWQISWICFNLSALNQEKKVL